VTSVAAKVLSVEGLRRDIAKRFKANRIDTPRLDARVLLAHALRLDHAGLVRESGRVLAAAEITCAETLVARRIAREPVARIIGVQEFWGMPLALSAATLVPRPETETVVEAALAAVGKSHGRGLRIADLGTGSGAIMLALLAELPEAIAIGTDRDRVAIAAARHNAARLSLALRAMFAVCDFGAALAGGFDLVVANPPYVRTGDIAALDPEVRDHDPHFALDGGPDGLAAYRAIVADARRLLAPNAPLVVEIGIGQSDAVAALIAAAGLCNIVIAPDLAGMPRAITARRDP
jgi:release factor glutamine methyltransferase